MGITWRGFEHFWRRERHDPDLHHGGRGAQDCELVRGDRLPYQSMSDSNLLLLS
jgi:hypothetical protein